MTQLRFEDLPKAMETVLQKLSIIEQELSEIREHYQPKEPEELMTRKETADYLKINSSTLWNWTKKGKLTSYGLGSRVYYKRGEVKSKLQRIN